MTTFASLGIAAPIQTALAEYGYETPTVIQEKAIPAGIAGRDVLGSAQTGTGKTCAFGVPILQRLAAQGHGKPIRALILTPTRELAIQIDDNLHAYGKHLPLTEAVIFGGVGQAPQVEKLKRGVDILTATPGRLLDLAGQGLLDLSQVEIFVLDEADRMLDMGFIHDVRKVIKLLPEKKQTMFFSATLPPEILDLVDTLLHDPVKVAAAPISTPVEVIRQEVCLVDRKNKTDLLLEILQQENVSSALVFTRTKHGADKVARDLTRKGVTAAAIHGNKSQTARQESLRKFKSGELRVLVATDIAARGLDIEDLSYVFNYNLSEVPETYIHRIGRTGRAGKGGTAISFCDYGELPMLKDIEKLLKKPIPRREHDYPMQVFEAPKKDSKGRLVYPEDAEARQAAREKNAARKQAAAEKAAQKAAKEAEQAEKAQQAAASEAPADESKSRKRRRGKHCTEAAAPEAQQQAQPAPQVGHQIKAEQRHRQGVADDHHLITHGDEHHVEGPVGGGHAVPGHVVDLGGLSAGGRRGDGADIEAHEGVAQAAAEGGPVAQPSQDQVGARGLTPHEGQHESQPQQQPAGPELAQGVEQPGDGLVPEQQPAGEGHQRRDQADPHQGLFPVHPTRTPFSASRPASMRLRLSSSNCPFMARMLPAIHSSVSSS